MRSQTMPVPTTINPVSLCQGPSDGLACLLLIAIPQNVFPASSQVSESPLLSAFTLERQYAPVTAFHHSISTPQENSMAIAMKPQPDFIEHIRTSSRPLLLHRRVKDDSFRCSCGQNFKKEENTTDKAARGNLTRHLHEQNHRGQFVCNECGHKTARSSNLTQHWRNRHSNIPMPKIVSTSSPE